MEKAEKVIFSSPVQKTIEIIYLKSQQTLGKYCKTSWIFENNYYIF